MKGIYGRISYIFKENYTEDPDWFIYPRDYYVWLVKQELKEAILICTNKPI